MRNLTWLIVTKYLYHKWKQTCFVCRNDIPVLFSFVTVHRVCSYISTAGATSKTRIATLPKHPCSPPGFQWDSHCLILSFRVAFCRTLFVLFVLAIVFSVLTVSDYPFGIFKPLWEEMLFEHCESWKLMEDILSTFNHQQFGLLKVVLS